VILGPLAILGGLAMKRLRGYGLAVLGAIAAIIPLGGCCVLSTPFGIWALIVLMNADVKEAFRANTGWEDYRP